MKVLYIKLFMDYDWSTYMYENITFNMNVQMSMVLLSFTLLHKL